MCELCNRQASNLTKHHLIPKMRHRNKRVQKMFTREQMHEQILVVCRACHSYLHRTISEKELALKYNTKQALLSHPEIRKFVSWLATKPDDFKPKSVSCRK